MEKWLAGEGGLVDEAVSEWQHWRDNVPLSYPDVAAMPRLTARGFQYLCHTYPPNKRNTMHEQHEEMLRIVQERVNRY